MAQESCDRCPAAPGPYLHAGCEALAVIRAIQEAQQGKERGKRKGGRGRGGLLLVCLSHSTSQPVTDSTTHVLVCFHS